MVMEAVLEGLGSYFRRSFETLLEGISKRNR